jgi:hypothetical protein
VARYELGRPTKERSLADIPQPCREHHFDDLDEVFKAWMLYAAGISDMPDIPIKFTPPFDSDTFGSRRIAVKALRQTCEILTMLASDDPLRNAAGAVSSP